MTSLLITGGTQDERLEAAQKKAAKVSSGPDLVILDDAVGIDEVKQIKSNLSRKPYQSKTVTVIISFADKMSPEASNALLKILEEPPGFAQIILLASSPTLVLPTVKSRCLHLDLGRTEISLNEANLKLAWKLYRTGSLNDLFDSSLAASPIIWATLIRQLLLYRTGGKQLLAKADGNIVLTDFVEVKEMEQVTGAIDQMSLQSFLHQADQASEDLNHNVNQKLVMENLLLALPKANL